ncbi:MAG: TRAP transporter permease [Lentisphaeria bacterium]|nr:TRAP transporter permease [Lentisphaeria bacterium]
MAPHESEKPASEGATTPDTAGADAAGAQSIAEAAEAGARELRGGARLAVALIAGGWSVFQLLLPVCLRLNSDTVRVIHLCCALALVYLCCPARRLRLAAGRRATASAVRLPWWDVALAVAAAGAASYLAFDYVGIGSRQGMPLARDMVAGLLLLVLLLEGARRAVGPALPTVAAVFVLLSFFGESLPASLAFKNVSLPLLLGQLTMSTEGIYGMPLHVSATTVFLFVLFGAFLEKSGGGQYFVQLAFAVMGRLRGGPAKAAVLASGLTGLVSGSSVANTVTTGTFTIPLMKRAGYPAEKAAAIEVAASTNGQLLPPVMGAAAFIIAERCGVPYLEVVRAAFLPAVISYLALFYITHLEAIKLGLQPLPRDRVPAFWPRCRSGLYFLPPLGLLIWLLFRRFSPELAAFWSIASLAVTVTLRELLAARSDGRPLRHGAGRVLRILAQSLVTGGRNMMGIGVAVAAAGIIVGIMTLGPGSLVTEVIGTLSHGSLPLMLILAALVSLLLGMGLPTTANYIVVSTLAVPAILTLSAQQGLALPLLAVHLFCFFFGILADDTPPVGLAAYAAAAIAGSNPIRTGIQGFVYDLRTALLPFMFLFNTELLLMDVRGPLHLAVVFASALTAMFAFAAASQGVLHQRNRLTQTACLLLAAAILFRPGFFAGRTALTSRALWQVIGFACFATAYLLEYLFPRPQPKPLRAAE